MPGGKLDPGELFDVGLAREVLEETGLDIEIIRSAGTAEQMVKGFHVIHLVMVARPLSGNVRLSGEHQEFRWCDLSEVNSMDLTDWMGDYFMGYLSFQVDRLMKAMFR